MTWEKEEASLAKRGYVAYPSRYLVSSPRGLQVGLSTHENAGVLAWGQHRDQRRG